MQVRIQWGMSNERLKHGMATHMNEIQKQNEQKPNTQKLSKQLNQRKTSDAPHSAPRSSQLHNAMPPHSSSADALAETPFGFSQTAMSASTI